MCAAQQATCQGLSPLIDISVRTGKDAFVNNTWPQFLSSLQAQLVKHKQDTFPGLSALKLLVTNFIDFPQATEDELADEDTQG